MSKQQNPEPVRRGFPGLPCPFCGEEDTVKVSIADMECSCSECEKEWTIEHMVELINAWQSVLSWLLHAPVVKEE